MKKGQIVESIVEKVEFPNKGILHSQDGEKIIVKHCIPGQKIRLMAKKRRKGKWEGQLLEVIEPSSLELEKPVCIHAGSCGGCSYQTLGYEQQLIIKQNQVKELLCPIVNPTKNLPGQITPDTDLPWFFGIKPSPRQFGYRNKMEYSFGDEYLNGPLALGLHKRNSFYDLVTTDYCQIVDSDFNQILSAALLYFSNTNANYLKKNTHIGYLRHLLVRKAANTGEILIDLVTTTQSCSPIPEPFLLNGFCKALLRLPLSGTIVGVLHTKNDSLADVIKDEGTQILFGQDYFYEKLLGLKFKITPFSFFQTNSLGAEILYDTVRDMLFRTKSESNQVIFDLYCGTGTIAQLVAPAAHQVIGVEIVEEAVTAARENAALNGLTNCKFIAADVLKALDEIPLKPDFLILDPPREGIHPKALKKIIDFGVERMIYISCKPTSLAKDLGVLQESGYEVEECWCVDLFPGTIHVETVCLLSKLHSDQHIEVELQMDELDLTAAESKATYEEIKDYVLEHSGLKVSNLYIAQIKQKCGIIERVNYNLPKSENSRQPKCPPEKEAAIREALEHFRMI